jgi:hypothetical protein
MEAGIARPMKVPESPGVPGYTQAVAMVPGSYSASRRRSWSRPVLESPVTGPRLLALADHLRGISHGSPDRLAEILGVSVRSERLAAAAGGAQAQLRPSPGGFVVALDPDPAPGEPEGRQHAEARRRFRLAHELSHVLFFSPTAPHMRIRRMEWGEEEFCDRLAALLLVAPPSTDRLDAAGLVALAVERRAPLAAVLAAATYSRPAPSCAIVNGRADGLRILGRCGPRSGSRRLSAAAAGRHLAEVPNTTPGPVLVVVRDDHWSSTLLQEEPMLLA